jgi:hypothetical protein
MRPKLLIVAACVGLVMATAISLPASATPKPADPSAHPRVKASGKAKDDSASTTSLACYGYDNPSPTYSSSNNTVHWGMKTICNYTDPDLSIDATLYSITGSGDNQTYVWQDRLIKSGAGSSLSVTTSQSCITRTSGRWIVKTYASTGTIGNLLPYPAWGPVFTIPCSDIS